MSIFIILLRFITAAILFQTLFFKFSGAEESVYIFTTVGMEPWGRIGSGIAELIAGILLVWPRYYHIGALVSLGVISGAIFFHLTVLGIEVQGDSGQLFLYALAVFICSAILVFHRKDQILTDLKIKNPE